MKYAVQSLVLGILAALGALVVEIGIFALVEFFSIREGETLNISSQLYNIFSTLPQKQKLTAVFVFFLATIAIVEESFKYFVISHRIDQYALDRKIILHSLVAGIGFSLIEIYAIYSKFGFGMDSLLDNKFQLLEILVIHVTTFGILGYFVAIRNPKKFSTFFSGVLFTSIIHFSYNAFSFYRNFYLTLVIYGILAIITIITLWMILTINKKLAQ